MEYNKPISDSKQDIFKILQPFQHLAEDEVISSSMER